MLALPSAAEQLSSSTTLSLFAGSLLVNLVSGVVISEVAINSKKAGSFKELISETVAVVTADRANDEGVSGLPLVPLACSMSVLINWSVLCFALSRFTSFYSPHGSVGGTAGFVVGVVALLHFLEKDGDGEGVLKFMSALVMCLFVAFGGLVLPCLSHAVAGGAAYAYATSGGAAEAVAEALPETVVAQDTPAAIANALPLFVMSGVFQNIVPIVAKNLNYERDRILPAICLGTILPTSMYLFFIQISLGGGAGIDLQASSNPLFMSVFACVATVASTIGCTLSLSRELQDIAGHGQKQKDEP